MEVPIQFQARHYTDVTLAGVGNDAANLVLREAPLRVQEGVTFELNAGF